jgi:hypothetical protein
MKKFLILYVSLSLLSSSLHAFDKVVIWGHKLHSHTHSYIHNAFYMAFNYLGYETYWFDDNDDVSGFDFSNAFFLSEGQVDHRIPLRKDGIYCLHNASSDKYKDLDPKLYFSIQVYNSAVHQMPNLIKVEPCIYYDFPGKCVYMPWATDLLPHEIDVNKKKLKTTQVGKYCIWVGTIGAGVFGNVNELTPFIKGCNEQKINFVHRGGNVSVEDNINLTMQAYLAPAIVGTWQLEHEYVPCRIFKNISYGKPGVTNSKVVYELFEKKIVYNPDTYALFFDAMNRTKNITLDEIYEQMDFVKTKHTYINRIQTLLDFMDCLEAEEQHPLKS